uniref:ribonuclease H n=1 Tax=Sinocyclocheilus rhinocerous TaxID=307959 RepID=A0A673IYZ6_9TELE
MRQYNMIKMIKNLYDKATCAVYLNSNIGDWFRTTVGVRQGCLLSPTLFNIFLERIMADALEDHEGTVSIGGRTITNLRFADDIVGLAGKEEELTNLVERLYKISTSYGMQINAEKTKLMTNNNKIGFTTDIRIGGEKLDSVNRFKYLGAIVADEESKPEILKYVTEFGRPLGHTYDDDLLTVVKKMEAEVVRPFNKVIRTCEDSPAGHSARREEERQAEKEMGKQHSGVDRPDAGRDLEKS